MGVFHSFGRTPKYAGISPFARVGFTGGSLGDISGDIAWSPRCHSRITGGCSCALVGNECYFLVYWGNGSKPNLESVFQALCNGSIFNLVSEGHKKKSFPVLEELIKNVKRSTHIAFAFELLKL